MEDIDFNNKFKIFTTSQIESRVLFNPIFIEKFKMLAEMLKTTNIKFSIWDNHVILAIATKHNFAEFGNLFKPLDDPRAEIPFCDEINTFTDLLEYIETQLKL